MKLFVDNSMVPHNTRQSAAMRFIYIAIGAVLGAVLAMAFMKSHSATTRNGHYYSSSGKESFFFLGVTVKFRSLEDKQYFKSLFVPMANYVDKFEEKTMSYKLYESDSNPLQGFILERYVNKDAFVEIHRKSQEFNAFRSKLKTLEADKGVVLDGHSYIETDIGFI